MTDWLEPYVGQTVVAEFGDGFTIFGTLAACSGGHLEFTQADLHDQNEANSSRDVYALETQRLGIRANRTRVSAPRHRLVAICRLDEVTG